MSMSLRLPHVSGIVLTLLALLFSLPAHAIRCLADDGGTRFTQPIGSSIAVPNTSPIGTIVWRSTKVAQVTCTRTNGVTSPVEELFFYIDPSSSNRNFTGIEFGIEYLGTQFWGTNKIPSGLFYDNRPNLPTKYPVKFSVLIRTTAAAQTATGFASRIPNFDVFQVDGVGGLDGANNYRYAVSGLTDIRFVPCGVTAQVTPAIVNMPTIRMKDVKSSGQNLGESPFSINLNKSCNASVRVTASFSSPNGFVNAGGTITKAVKSSDNSDSGLGISLFFDGGPGNPVVYDEMTPLDSMSENVRNKRVPMLARVVSVNPSLLKPGGYSALLIFSIFLQ